MIAMQETLATGQFLPSSTSPSCGSGVSFCRPDIMYLPFIIEVPQKRTYDDVQIGSCLTSRASHEIDAFLKEESHLIAYFFQ